MKIKRIIIGLLLTVYLLVAVFLTACLLTYNDYKISVFGDKSLIIVKNDDFEPNYKKGSLLIVKKNNNEDIRVNDDIFFYNTYKNQIVVSYSRVVKTEKITDTQTTYTITGNYELSSDYVIGKADTTKVINNVGNVMSFLESRWGFLLLIVLPISMLFVYEIYVVVKEIVRPEDDDDKKVVKTESKKDENLKVQVNPDVEVEKDTAVVEESTGSVEDKEADLNELEENKESAE